MARTAIEDNMITVRCPASLDNPELANGVAFYIPKAVRESCNLDDGDTFIVKVVNNKCAIKYDPEGDHTMVGRGKIHVKLSRFDPPLRSSPSVHIPYALKDGWLAVQLPKELEYIEKGFQRLRPEPDTKGFDNAE